MRRAAIGLILLVGACADGAPTRDQQAGGAANAVADMSRPAAGTATPRPKAALALADDGFRIVDPANGENATIPFGSDRQAVLDRVARLRGAATEQGENSECGVGPIEFAQFDGGLSLIFQQDKFAGWSVNQGGDQKLTTVAGIGLGATRKALEAAYPTKVEESTLGTEFVAGGVSGLLEDARDSAKITDLWAGATCIAR
ncbi:MAG: hypothetical protein B7Y45_02860 [Sphingomonas sp. 28-66-16]|nr:MAG: hypothetical protein B7Y45_02860 [Sphingomonas sp. 28-66-16]